MPDTETSDTATSDTATSDTETLPPLGEPVDRSLVRADRAVRGEIEDFLYDEADLLDSWRLDEWLALFAEDGHYSVPSTDLPDGDDELDLALINDDRGRLEGRIYRLKSNWAHIENPHSRLRRIIGNVRVWHDRNDELVVLCSVVVYRCRRSGTSTYVSHLEYRLRRAGDSLLIVRRRAVLDHLTLRDCGGVLSIIV
jgi:p-cumate 2,3-dioxygenase subunit beta